MTFKKSGNQRIQEEGHMKKQLSCNIIVLTLVGFIALWAVVTDAWGYSDRFFGFSAGKYVYAYISRLIWTLPAILLIVKQSDSLRIGKKELFSRPRFDMPLISVITVSSAVVVVTMLISYKGFWINTKINPLLEMIKYIAVGCAEETVFRGWGYNALANVTSDRKAAVVSSALFVILHWCAYFVRLYRFKSFDLTAMLIQSFSAMLWGLIFCWMLKKSKTIWNPIIAHSVYDYMSVLLVG